MRTEGPEYCQGLRREPGPPGDAGHYRSPGTMTAMNWHHLRWSRLVAPSRRRPRADGPSSQGRRAARQLCLVISSTEHRDDYCWRIDPTYGPI